MGPDFTRGQTRYVWFHNFWKFMLPALIGWLILGVYLWLGRTETREQVLPTCLTIGLLGTAICAVLACFRLRKAIKFLHVGLPAQGKVESVSKSWLLGHLTGGAYVHAVYSYRVGGLEFHKGHNLTRWYIDLSLAGEELHLLVDPDDASRCMLVGYVVPGGVANLPCAQQALQAPGAAPAAGKLSRREAARMRLARTHLKWWMFPMFSLVTVFIAFNDYSELTELETHGKVVQLYSLAAVAYDMFGKWGTVVLWLGLAAFLLWAGWYLRPPRKT